MMSTPWPKLLLASAWTTLDARDALLPAKLQRAVAPASLQDDVEAAKEARATFLAESAELVRHLTAEYMPSEGAAACFQAAARCLRVERATTEGEQRCAFGGDKAPGRVQATLFGNGRAPGAPAREEFTCVVAPKWVPVLEAAIVACNATEWLDQEVAAWLDAADTKLLTRELAARLLTDDRLSVQLASAYEGAKRTLVEALEAVTLSSEPDHVVAATPAGAAAELDRPGDGGGLPKEARSGPNRPARRQRACVSARARAIQQSYGAARGGAARKAKARRPAAPG